jgi:hypothetical protein
MGNLAADCRGCVGDNGDPLHRVFAPGENEKGLRGKTVEMSNLNILFLAAVGFIALLAGLVPIAFLPWRRSSRDSAK